MRRLLHLVAQLDATVAADAESIRGISERREEEVAEAERMTRESIDLKIASANALSDARSLGGVLREDLSSLPHVNPRHVDPGLPPANASDAVAEWDRLARTVEQQVRRLADEVTAWNQRLVKRAKSAPQVDDSVWRDLDRLDMIHRALPSLRQAAIAARVREVAGAADVVLAAEMDRQSAAQNCLVDELRAALQATHERAGLAAVPWSDSRWRDPTPSNRVEHLIRLGDLHPNLPKRLAVDSIPALIPFPMKSGLAVGARVGEREQARRVVRAVLLRVLAAVPPGEVVFKVADAVAVGQSVAEFRHLAEYDSQLMDEKTWTSERDIERLMDDFSEYLEVVISRYLRGQFESIDEYNEHAGEVAQPYRVLAVFDYPAGFTDRASRQLLSLIENGPRCGVYTVLHHDLVDVVDVGSDPTIDRLVQSMDRVVIRADGARLSLADPIGSISLGLVPDADAPIAFDHDGQPQTGYAALLARVGEAVRAQASRPPVVTLASLLPVLGRSRSGALPRFTPGSPAFGIDSRTWWTASTQEIAVAPIGRSGAQGVASMYFSSTEVAGGAIVVGLPRSGKTTCLHSLVMTMAMLYSPEELEFYLIDAKHGVEFKAYETLPHARMVSVHSEREFSLAVLKNIDAEIRRRAELMKADGRGRANLTEFRAATGERLARIVVVIDEFHELFEETDSIGQEAFAAFSNIVRMGPFSGVHVVVASQTLSSMPAMDRQTLTLLPQRVAFMCNEYDSEIVMGDSNRGTRSLSKTGEGLFNPARGDEARNQPFQGLYISVDERAELVRQLGDSARQIGWNRTPRVFDGDAVVPRPRFEELLGDDSKRLRVPLGEPFSLAIHEALTIRRTRGANVLLLHGGDQGTGVNDHALRGALHSFVEAARICGSEVSVLDFVGDEDVDGVLTMLEVARATGAGYERSSGMASVLLAETELVAARTAAQDYVAPQRLLLLHGIERAVSMTPFDPYGDDALESGSLLAKITRDGPEVGIHVVLWADRMRTVERRLGTELIPEFAFRLGGSATDQGDLAAVAGQFGAIQPLRHGQLLLGDQLRGVATRIRGYEALQGSVTSPTERTRNDE